MVLVQVLMVGLKKLRLALRIQVQGGVECTGLVQAYATLSHGPDPVCAHLLHQLHWILHVSTMDADFIQLSHIR